jgi:hypothetical protein
LNTTWVRRSWNFGVKIHIMSSFRSSQRFELWIENRHN